MQAHTGKRPIIYTDPKFHREVLEGEFTDYHFWLRSVAAETELGYRDRRWSFWQFTTTGTCRAWPAGSTATASTARQATGTACCDGCKPGTNASAKHGHAVIDDAGGMGFQQSAGN